MKKFKFGEVYRVGSDCLEKGNIIRITGVTGNHGCVETYLYETMQGKGPRHSMFDFGTTFSRSLEPVKKESHKIVITTDGKTTIAKLYDGQRTVREATAVCSDSDTFDFNVGAGIALARLTGRHFLGVNLSQPEYKTDDVKLSKPKTLRDVVAEREPKKVSEAEFGGVKGCPCSCDYLRGAYRKACCDCDTCEECWSQPYTPKETEKPESESQISPELKQLIPDDIIDACIQALNVIAKIRPITTGGTNHE